MSMYSEYRDAAEKRIADLEEQLEALRQALRDSWDDYAVAIDEHASDEVRKEARHAMLRRFSVFQDEGWLDSNPAISPQDDGLEPIETDWAFKKDSAPASRQDA